MRSFRLAVYKMIGVLLIMTILVIFASCKTPKDLDGTPRWTQEVPKSASFLYVTGYGKLSNVQTSLMRAEAMARDRIGRWASTKVRGALTNYFQDFESINGQSVEIMEIISSQIVNVSIQGSLVEEQWVTPEGGVWVLMSYPIKNLKEAYILRSQELERQNEANQTQRLIEYLERELERE